MNEEKMEKYLKKYQKPLIFEKLNRKLLKEILKYLSMDEISKLNVVCRRFNNLVQSSIQELQVFCDGEGEPLNLNHLEFRYVVLRYTSPGDFFYPFPPFKNLRALFLCYDDEQNEIINLTKLMQLKYLKIRGAKIELSANRLPSVTHVDIDDPNNCQKQVFRNLKNFHLEVNIEDFSQIYNSTEPEAMKHIFLKTYDILLDKEYLEQISFTIIIGNMKLLIFEGFVDCITNFLRKHEEEINCGFVELHFKHTSYEVTPRESRRWDKVWHFLEHELPANYTNLKLEIEEIEQHHQYIHNYIPVD